MAISSAMMDGHGPFQLFHPLTLRLQCHQTAAFIYLLFQKLLTVSKDCIQTVSMRSSAQLVPANALLPIKHLYSSIKLDEDSQT